MASGTSQSKYRHAIQKQMQTQMSYHHLIMELMRFIHRLLDLLQKRCWAACKTARVAGRPSAGRGKGYSTLLRAGLEP